MTYLRIALMALFLMPLSPAHAHKVIASVYASGEEIEGEIGFSNGDMAADALVEVFDEKGNKLGETRTSADGTFTFKPTVRTAHIFRSNLGAGHVAEFRMEAAELPDIAGAEPPPTPQNAAAAPAGPGNAAASPAASPTPPAVDMAALMEEQRKLIDTAVQRQVNPLRRDLIAFQEKANLQSILGGIGYIFGLFGVAYYVAARRRLGKA